MSGNLSEDKLVVDSSVDYLRRPPLRATTGTWKAAMFIILIEFSERLSYFGIATNLMIYMTKVLHQDMKVAAENVTYWVGVSTVMPLFGGLVADAFMGRFATVILSTGIYLMGLVLLAMTQLLPGLKPTSASPQLHETLFFVGIYLLSVGTGGHKPALESFGADQFDDGHAGERLQKMSFFNYWNCALCSGVILGVTVVVYLQERAGWGAATVLLTSVMGVSLIVFLAGWKKYRYRPVRGSPLTPLVRVMVAAARKHHLKLPADANELYQDDEGKMRMVLCHTDKLRFLDKAAIMERGVEGAWRLATVSEVEGTKLVVSMVPIWVATLAFGITATQVSTFFIKQGTTMDRRLGIHFILPPASIFSLAAVAMIATVAVYDWVLEPCLRKRRKNAERGISILQRIGIGMAFTVAAMVVASIVERRRLHMTSPTMMSVFWLAPQFALMGIGDGFALVGLQEFFYEQVPDTMRSLGIGLYLSVIGAGSFLSNLVIKAADRVSSRGGHTGWFGKDLNRSRLDLFYCLLAGIGGANLCFYILVASRYSYKQTIKTVNDKFDEDVEVSTATAA
ncbi:protein NRT1/ PTR FAMILY 5.6-like [Lolium rigidum]|uniref:protein NRT1/ PTR FAMILY 5.6-like n=1 Tax=Lolium rigidum TaxID=89674 RepID=UPI001F5CE955|nr:protein NRT1/ PTR FAMILY 5.6-like [Lolium rigidum]